MNEKVKNELEMAAKLLGMSSEDVQTKWTSIVNDNDLDVNNESELKLGLTNQWHQLLIFDYFDILLEMFCH